MLYYCIFDTFACKKPQRQLVVHWNWNRSCPNVSSWDIG